MKVSSHRLFLTWALAGATVASAGTTSSDSFRLPAEFPPEVACWFWGEADFKPGGYKEKIDLLADFLLMRVGEQGREVVRQLAINYLLELVRQQNASVEGAFYSLVKKWLGPAALVGTHPTWISDPDNQGEYQRSGLDWWAVKRDLAQTDEEIPFCVGTALSKKWNSPFWLNMYYNTDIEAYRQRLWKYAVSGGRMNFHPVTHT